jgi:predicted DNA-binding helix-hairpin-helix protein
MKNITLILILFCCFFSFSAKADTLNLVCELKSFCSERPPESCKPSIDNSLPNIQHLKVSAKEINYFDDNYLISIYKDDLFVASRIEQHLKHNSLTESLIKVNRFTGLMNVTHTLKESTKPLSTAKILAINRVVYECKKIASKF